MQLRREVSERNTEPNALEVSRKLARLIGESAQFQRYAKMSEVVRADQEFQRLYTEFQEAQQTLQMTRSWGGASREDFQRLESLREKLFSNPTMKDFSQAQDDIEQLVKELNVFISEKLGFDFANLTKPAGGCC